MFADSNTIDAETVLPAGSAFKDPDNLAIDPAGNMYIVEDQDGIDRIIMLSAAPVAAPVPGTAWLFGSV